MDLRNVKPLPAADEVTSASDDPEVTVASPKRRRHGYEIDDFVVDSSESDGYEIDDFVVDSSESESVHSLSSAS